MIKLALTDLDNTLIPLGAPHASLRAIAAIHAMLDAGLHFGPVSGRVPAAMRWMFGGDEACSRTGAFVNGQLVYVDGQLVHEELLPGEELAEVGTWIGSYEGCALVVYDLDDLTETTDGTAYYMGATAEELARHESTFGRRPHMIERLDRPTYIKSNVRCDMPWHEMIALRDELRERFPAFDFVFPTMYGPFIDILPHGWSKGCAVKVLSEHLGLTLDEVAVFGDSENDISMLEVVPHSVVVRNASADALSVANYRIGLSADDAVADALFALAEAAKTGECPAFLRPLDPSVRSNP
ncbi:MAG: HAD family phosphatase [Atopobiaceae bacterium]|nr:HAD family phosphatase [Atopobiaceae bacterium]MBR1828718.1 HAD family phosphatase [Atopobiaceae bacterium]